jgi:hypothetical protein
MLFHASVYCSWLHRSDMSNEALHMPQHLTTAFHTDCLLGLINSKHPSHDIKPNRHAKGQTLRVQRCKFLWRLHILKRGKGPTTIKNTIDIRYLSCFAGAYDRRAGWLHRQSGSNGWILHLHGSHRHLQPGLGMGSPKCNNRLPLCVQWASDGSEGSSDWQCRLDACGLNWPWEGSSLRDVLTPVKYRTGPLPSRTNS